MAKLKLPFELEKPSSNEYVTQTSEIGHKGSPLEGVIDKSEDKVNALADNIGVEYRFQGGMSANQTVACSLSANQRINISFNASYGCGIAFLDLNNTLYGAATHINIYIADIPLPTRVGALETEFQSLSPEVSDLPSAITWNDDYFVAENGNEASASTYSIATLYISAGETFIFSQYMSDYAAIVFTDGTSVLEAHLRSGELGSLISYEAPVGATYVRVSVLKAKKSVFVYKRKNLSLAITKAQALKKDVDANTEDIAELQEATESLNECFEITEFPQMLNSEAFLANYRPNGSYNSNIEDVVSESGWTTLNAIYLADGASRTLAVNMNTNFYMYMYVKSGDNYLEFANVNPDAWTAVDDHWEYTINNANIKAIRCKVVTTNLPDTPKITMADKWAGSSPEYKPEGQKTLSSDISVGQIDEFEAEVNAELSSMNTQLSNSQRIDLGTLGDGFVNSSNGNLVSATSYKVTALLPINSDSIEVVATANVANVGIAFYDHNFRYVSGSDFTDKSFGDKVAITLSKNVCYLRYCAINAQASKMAIYVKNYGNILARCARVSDNPCYYVENDFCKVFKKILCIGDSLTQGTFEYNEGGTNTEIIIPEYSYPTFLSAISGREVTNKGDAGKSTKTWWNIHQNDDLSGHDACLIALGTNDAIGGSAAQTTSEERFTYMGNIINKVKQENPHIKIFIATMLNLYSTSNERIAAVNADMRTIAANTADCYLVDILANGDLIPSDRFSHLTAVGYLKLAHFYFNYISYIIAHNMADFRLVQFIGTEHTHS